MKRYRGILLIGMMIGLQATAALMSPSTKLRLNRPVTAASREDSEPPYRPLLLQVDGEETVEELREMGVEIFNSREDILLACVPVNKVGDVLELPGLLVAETTGEITTMLDVARPFCSVDIVQEGGAELPHGYDGEGIVVGFSDIGFDARHIAFLDRISAIYDYDAAYGKRSAAVTPEEISGWTTDDAENYHATHVGNILGGIYRGNPYYGVATGAEMVATTSRLTDVGILAGVEEIIAYAKERGKRAVVNLSLGSYLGAHDGSSLVCRYLSACAEEAVICLSSGNNGERSIYASAWLDDTDHIYRVIVNSLTTWNGYKVDGMTEFWSDTSNPFDFRIEVWDMDSREVVFATDWANEENSQLYVNAESYPGWAEMMDGDGYVYAECGVSALNGRYCASVMYNTETSESAANSEGRWSRYYTALAFRQSPRITTPVHVDIFADAIQTCIGRADNLSSPEFSADGSVSDLCTAEGVIAVGNCESRNTVPSLTLGTLELDFPVNRIAMSSSYSDVFTMPRLPHFAAPGKYVVSAMSGYYPVLTDPLQIYLSAEAMEGRKSYYWIALSGTSMSSPLAAGIMAQWLQANPELTTEQLIEIAQSTARTDFEDIENPRWGAGCIDALAGIRMIEQASAPVITNDSGLCDVYTLEGIRILSRVSREKIFQSLSPGVYIVDRQLVVVN